MSATWAAVAIVSSATIGIKSAGALLLRDRQHAKTGGQGPPVFRNSC